MISEVQILKQVKQHNIFMINFYAFLLSLAFSEKVADFFGFMMLFIFLAKLIRKGIKIDDSIVMLSFKLLMGAYFLSFLFSSNSSGMNFFDYLSAFQSLLSYLSPLLLYIMLSSMEITEKQIENSLFLIISSSCVAFIFFFFFSHPPYSIDHRLSFLGHPNKAALYIVMYCIILFSVLVFKQKCYIQIGKLVMLFIGLATLLFTYTRSAWIGLFVATSVLCLSLKSRKVIVILIIVIVVFGTILLISPDFNARIHSIFDVNYSSNSSRITIWSTAFEIFNLQKWFVLGPNKITGIGPKNFKNYFQKIHPHYFEKVPHAHNDLLETLTEFGLVGLLCFLFFIIILYYYAFKSWRQASTDLERVLANIVLGLLVVWSVHGMVDLTRTKETSMYLLMVMLAFLGHIQNGTLKPKKVISII